MANYMPPVDLNRNPEYYNGNDPNPNNHLMWAEKLPGHCLRVNNLPLHYTTEMVEAEFGYDPHIRDVDIQTDVLPEGPMARATIFFHSAQATFHAIARMNGTRSPFIQMRCTKLNETERSIAANFDRYGLVEDVKIVKTANGTYVRPLKALVIFGQLEHALQAQLAELKKVPPRFLTYGPFVEDQSEFTTLRTMLTGYGPTLEDPCR